MNISTLLHARPQTWLCLAFLLGGAITTHSADAVPSGQPADPAVAAVPPAASGIATNLPPAAETASGVKITPLLSDGQTGTVRIYDVAIGSDTNESAAFTRSDESPLVKPGMTAPGPVLRLGAQPKIRVRGILAGLASPKTLWRQLSPKAPGPFTSGEENQVTVPTRDQPTGIKVLSVGW